MSNLPRRIPPTILYVFSFLLFFFLATENIVSQRDGLTATESYELGVAALDDHDPEQAIEHFQNALTINENYFEALHQLAYAYYVLGEYAQSQKIAQRAQRLSYNTSDLAILQARIDTALGNYNDALQRYRTVLSDYPRNTIAQIGMAELMVAQGRFQDAIEAFERILTQDRANHLAYLSLAILYEWDGQVEASERAIENALLLQPLLFHTQYSAARYYLRRDMLQRALHHAEVAADLVPENSLVTELLVEIALRRTDISTALTLAQGLVNSDPTNTNYWYLQGLVLAEVESDSASLASFERALLIRRDEELPRIASEQILRKSSGAPSTRHTEFALYRFNKALQFQERNLLEQAISEYRRGLQLNSRSLEGRQGYADALLQFGFRARYLQELEVIKELGLGNTEIDDIVETFRSVLSDSVAVQWGVDQFTIPKTLITLDVMVDKTTSNTTYQESIYYIGHWLLDLFRSEETVTVNDDLWVVRLPSEAHTVARDNGSDYYLYISIGEFNESILFQVELKSSRTGTTIRSYRTVYSGSDRIQRATRRVVGNVINDLPLRAQLVDRRNNRALINIGSLQGAKEGDVLLVVSQGTLEVAFENPRLVFDSNRVVGHARVVRVDDLVSEVMLMPITIFDTFNIGDEVIFQRHGEVVETSENYPNPLYQRLRLIR